MQILVLKQVVLMQILVLSEQQGHILVLSQIRERQRGVGERERERMRVGVLTFSV